MNSTFLNQFKIVNPKNCVAQDDLLEWIVRCHQVAEKNNGNHAADELDSIAKLFSRYGVKSSKISQRYFECDDIRSLEFGRNTIYKLDVFHKCGLDIMGRADFFSERRYDVFKKFYDIDQIVKRPDHLIHVTCTGYISPSAAQKIVTNKNWKQSTNITHAYHMGCYAAMPSIRLAKSLVVGEAAGELSYTVDIVHTEMCGLHMNPLAQTPEQMVVQTLFADGHVKYTASANCLKNGKNFKVIAILERVIPDTWDEMGWIPAPWGMKMNLSRDVPAVGPRFCEPEIFSLMALAC
jgi:prepilin-type processing-associated H-X9-DG protein